MNALTLAGLHASMMLIEGGTSTRRDCRRDAALAGGAPVARRTGTEQ